MASILIVEDEAHIASGLRFNLELEGHQVAIARDGAEGMRLLFADSAAYDLIILDLMLPELGGLEICRALRRRGVHTPVLMLTAKREEADKIYGLRLGADDYVVKPFNLEELLARVEALLRRQTWGSTQLPEGDRLEFGNVQLDFESFEARVGGKAIKLTAIEFGIMRLFRDREGHVVSREQLLETVWGWQTPATTRTVDNFILRLRKALEQDPSNPRHILSIRGVGYKFVR